MLLSEIQMEKHAALTRVSFTASGILFLHYAESIPPALHRIRPVECFLADHQKKQRESGFDPDDFSFSS